MPPPTAIPHAQVACRRMGDDWVLVHLGTGEVFQINATLGRIWQLIEQGSTRGEIVETMLTEYGCARDVIEKDLEGALKALAHAGLLDGAPLAADR